MGAAAELGAPAAGVHNADNAAVLLAEQRHSAHLLGFLDGQVLDLDVQALEDLLVDLLFDLDQLLGGDGAEMGEVKAGDVVVLIAARLMHMVAQNLTQRFLHQVGGGVVAADGHTALGIHGSGDIIANVQGAVQQLAGVDKVALGGLFDLRDLQLGIAAADVAVVSDLTAHLGIERGTVQHDQHALLALTGFVGGNGVVQLLAVRQGNDLGGLGQDLVAVKLGRLGGQLAEQVGAPAGDILGKALGAGALTLLGHFHMEGCFVHAHASLGGDLAGQVEGEAEGIVQLEHLSAGQNLLVDVLEAAHHTVQDVQTGVDGATKAQLLGADDLLDVAFMLAQLGVTGLAGLDDGIDQLGQEGAVDAQHTTVAGGAAQQAAHNVAATLVGGQNAVGCHKHGGADVVGDDADGDIVLVVLAVFFAGDALNMVQNGGDGVHLKQVAYALHNARQTLQTHTGVDVGLGKQLIVTLAVGVELAEHEVPDLHIAVAVAADAAGGLVAAVFLAAVKVNFAAGTAGTGAMLPEVVLFAEAHHVAFGDADDLSPDVVSLVVLLIDRDVQAVGGDLQLLGQKFPSPGNDLFFEVILKAEVAQHFKEAAVAGGDAHALDIRGADALLAGGHAVTRRLLLTEEPFFHGRHTAVDQQQAGVVLRYQGKAAQTQVILGFKKVQVFFAQFVQSGPLHSWCSPIRGLYCCDKRHQKNIALAPEQGRRLTASVVPPGLRHIEKNMPPLCPR